MRGTRKIIKSSVPVTRYCGASTCLLKVMHETTHTSSSGT